MNDPIVEEVRRIRAEHAARFNYDLWAIFRDIQEQQKRSGLTFVSFADAPNKAAPSQAPAPTEAVLPASCDVEPLQPAPATERLSTELEMRR